MPAEARYIVFSPDEINALIRRYAHARGINVPEGRLTQVEHTDQGYVLTFVNDFSRKQHFELPPEVLMAAILLDCRYQRLPVARRFDKRLEIIGSGVALVAHNDCAAAPTDVALDVGARARARASA
ncbi:MAG: hypothetical protein EA356_06670 [Geminicoccaceae bacterium]|nr:MAG: hypothetical protein EA356_06670 [Geminicoccaceae bacterium]